MTQCNTTIDIKSYIYIYRWYPPPTIHLVESFDLLSPHKLCSFVAYFKWNTARWRTHYTAHSQVCMQAACLPLWLPVAPWFIIKAPPVISPMERRRRRSLSAFACAAARSKVFHSLVTSLPIPRSNFVVHQTKRIASHRMFPSLRQRQTLIAYWSP